MKEIKLDVPFLSQYGLDVPEEWRPRACGIAAVAMAIDYIKDERQSISQLINEGLKLNAYFKGVGWGHAGLVEVAKNNGVGAYRKEFRKIMLPRPIAEVYIRWYLRRAISNKCIPIISLRFDGISDTHLVALTGFDSNGFIYNDSAKKTPDEGMGISISNEEFARRFRKLAIFICQEK